VVEDQEELFKQLGLNQQGQWVSLELLLEACYKRSAAILEADQIYFDRHNFKELSRQVDDLRKRNTPQTPLLRVGGGQGLLSITDNLWLLERDPELYEVVRQGTSLQRNWHTYTGNFPKTRRVIWRKGQPAALLGWIQFIPPKEIQNSIRFSPKEDASTQHVSVSSSITISTAPAKMESDRRTGQVKRFDVTKGYGFIAPDDGGVDIFVHISQVEGPPLREGERVSFIIGSGKKGPAAQKVKREK
jgi:CspA family cold shock protein